MQEITPTELKARLAAGDPIHVLDVREPEEYTEDNIGAKLLPLGHVMSMQTDDIDDWKEDPVAIMCRSGRRSMQAGMMLETMGFQNVMNVTGGILAWREQVGAENL